MDWLYHNNNIINKIKNNYKSIGEDIESFRVEYYEKFYNKIVEIKDLSYESIKDKVILLDGYMKRAKSFEAHNKITAQSKFYSTILEEFCGYLFKDLPELNSLGLDFYNKKIFAGMKIDYQGKVIVQSKDVDFCIGKSFQLEIGDSSYIVIIPVVAIECKTYLDNTMFNEAQFSAQKLKNGTPDVKIFILTERNEIGLDKLPSQSPIDEVFVIKQNEESINSDVVYDLFITTHNTIKVIV